MSDFAQEPRRVTVQDRGSLDVGALVLLSILLAAGFILNFTVGKAIAGISGGAISPEFIISAFCITILIVRPSLGQALVIGIISAAVIQVTTTSPLIDFVAEGVAAPVMAAFVKAGMRGSLKKVIPFVASFVATVLSGSIFMVIKLAVVGFAPEIVAVLPAAMLPVIIVTGAFNAILVQALYEPIRSVLKIGN